MFSPKRFPSPDAIRTHPIFPNGASKSTINNHGQTALLLSLRYNHPKVTKRIIESLQDPTLNLSVTDNAGYNILHYLGYCNDEEIIQVIEQYIYVDDIKVVVTEKNKKRSLFWNTDEYAFSLDINVDVSEEEWITIIKSIVEKE